jgi:unsaturated rhamnogalacturonyl hydrolase
MKRRSFIMKSSVFGGALIICPSPRASLISERGQSHSSGEDLRSRVKMAMLSMQRASWEQGVASQAFLETGDENLVILMARESVLRQAEDGRLAVLYQDNGVTDPACCGESLLHVAEITGDLTLKNAAEEMLKYLLEKAPRNGAGIIYHTIDAPQIWIDSMYMGPPFLACAGHYKEAVKQVQGIRSVLWNPDKKLFSHIWDDGKQDYKNKSFWGVGNGWAATGMCRVARFLPYEMMTEKLEIIGYIREVIDGCLNFMREDGLFHNVVNDSNTFVETNLSQMLAYTIFSAVREKWIDSSFLDDARKMRNAALAKVDEYGYVQDVCGAPYFNAPGRATEGQAFFLLMESAYDKLHT